MEINHKAHDEIYKILKKEGKIGWDDEKVYKKIRKELLKILGEKHVPNEGKFLESGCGAGNLTLWFAKRDLKYTGLTSLKPPYNGQGKTQEREK